MTILPETTIRYVDGPLGVIGRSDAVMKGDLGRMIGPLPDEGWFATEPAKLPGAICPVSREMIEVATDG